MKNIHKEENTSQKVAIEYNEENMMALARLKMLVAFLSWYLPFLFIVYLIGF